MSTTHRELASTSVRERPAERPVRPPRRPAALALLGALAVACGDDSVGSATAGETTTTTTGDTTTTTTTAMTTEEPTTSGGSESGTTTTTTTQPTGTTDPTDGTTTGTTDPTDSTSMPVSSTTDDETTTTGTTSGTTGAAVCEPGTTEDCYSGPGGTLGVGVCQAGVRTCVDDGTGFGPCVGEVTPGPEDCLTREDEDCLGDVPQCGAALWVQQFGGPLANETSDLAIGPDGGVAITGRFDGGLDLGGGPLTSAGLFDGYLARFDGDGGHLWSRRFGSAGQEYGRDVAFDAAGGVVLTANIVGAADLGGATLTSVGEQDLAVARYDAGGAHLWSSIFGGPDNQISQGVAVAGDDGVVLGGVFRANFKVGPTTLTSAGDNDIYLARLDGDGGPAWAKRFGSAGVQYAAEAVLAGADHILQAGYFAGQLDYGGDPLSSAGGFDVFVARLDGAGQHQWSRRFGDAGDQRIEALAADATGRALIGGRFDGVLDLGGGPLTSEGGFDGFVAVLGVDGAHVWSRRLGGPGSARVDAIAADPAGNVFVGGVFTQTLDLGGALLTAGPDVTAFVAEFSPAGELLHGAGFNAGAGYQWLSALAADAAGDLFVLGEFSEAIDISGELLTSVGETDIFLAKLAF